MRTSLDRWQQQRQDHPEQFVVHGPMWQPECEWCDWMGDVADSPEEARAFATEHECQVLVPVPMSELTGTEASA